MAVTERKRTRVHIAQVQADSREGGWRVSCSCGWTGPLMPWAMATACARAHRTGEAS